MTRHDPFDETVRAYLLAEAPREAPNGLLEAAMARVAGTPQRRHRSQFAGLGRVLAVAAVLVVAVIAGAVATRFLPPPGDGDASPTPSRSVGASAPPSVNAPAFVSTSAQPSPSAATEPSADSPAATASASAGSRSDLVLRLMETGGGPTSPAPPLPVFTLLADSTVVWQPADDHVVAPLRIRRLTPTGLEQLRERIFGGGLLDASATHELEPRPDAPPAPGRGVPVHVFTAGSDESVVVTSVTWLGEEEESTYYQLSPEREQLDALARELRDPEAIVDASAWADGSSRPFVAEEYRLVLLPMGGTPTTTDLPDAGQVAWPFDGALDEFGDEVGDPRPPETRCGTITTADAEGILSSLATLGYDGLGLDRVTYAMLGWAEGGGTVEVHLVPVLPDGYPACEDAP